MLKHHGAHGSEAVLADVREKTKRMEIEDLNNYLCECKYHLKAKNRDNFEDDEEDEPAPEEFDMVKSSASCNVADIRNIIFGSTTSRFWIFRKHMISMDQTEYKHQDKIPFFSWQCLTIQLKHRDIDLVIKN